MKPIVSYAIFESSTSIYAKIKGQSMLQFGQFLPLLIRGHYCVWRGFEMRIHHDDHVTGLPYWPVMERLASLGLVKLVPCGPAEALCKSMLWRMRPVFEPGNQVVICRDIDSVPMPRDRMAVEEWLLSGKAVHVIHDNPAHAGMMGGTTAVASERFLELVGVQTMEQFLALSPPGFLWGQQGTDQHLLNYLLPRFACETLVHDLHKRTTDMGPVDSRSTLAALMHPIDMPARVREGGDKLCFIGGCTDPLPGIMFYDSIDFPERDAIRRCELG